MRATICLAFIFHITLKTDPRASRYRTRVGGEQQHKWSRDSSGAPILPYGLHHLADARAQGHLGCVEGESDAITLRYHGITALGFPGNTTVAKLLTPAMVAGIPRLTISQEPGESGKVFRDGIIANFNAFRWCGKVYVIDWSKSSAQRSFGTALRGS